MREGKRVSRYTVDDDNNEIDVERIEGGEVDRKGMLVA